MGIVYEACHRRLDKRVAIKLLHGGGHDTPDIVHRFEREARAAVQLRGRNVARVFDVDTLPEGAPYMVMEYLEGRDLSEEMVERGVFPLSEAVGYVLEACAAMSEAHELGIVHRDLKPGNLFLSKYGDTRIVKVLDFGISKVTSEKNVSVTTTQSTLGTPLYMSPEQVRSAKHVDSRSDIWSLGVILYELVSGIPPFLGDSASAIIAAIAADSPQSLGDLRPDLPQEFVAIVMKTLQKEPALRFQTVDELADALAQFGPTGRGAVRAMSDWPRRSSTDLGAQAARALQQTLQADLYGRVPSTPELLTETHPQPKGSQPGSVGAGADALIARASQPDMADRLSQPTAERISSPVMPPSSGADQTALPVTSGRILVSESVPPWSGKLRGRGTFKWALIAAASGTLLLLTLAAFVGPDAGSAGAQGDKPPTTNAAAPPPAQATPDPAANPANAPGGEAVPPPVVTPATAAASAVAPATGPKGHAGGRGAGSSARAATQPPAPSRPVATATPAAPEAPIANPLHL
jgi:serine/threonine-protein kinase